MCEKCRELGIDPEDTETKAAYGFTMLMMNYFQFKYYERVIEIEDKRPDDLELAEWAEMQQSANIFDENLDEGNPEVKCMVADTARDIADLWYYVQAEEPDYNWIREPELRELVDTGKMSPLEYIAGVIGAVIARWAIALERVEEIQTELLIIGLNQMGGS
jgi:hypothetical protein